MNAISEFLVAHMVGVYFAYGLAFFLFGSALLIAGSPNSAFRFAAVLVPLALFGLLHGAHEWFEMFQIMAANSGSGVPILWHEVVRILLLTTSFVFLLISALLLLGPEEGRRKKTFLVTGALVVLCALAVAASARFYAVDFAGAVDLADVFVRYLIGIPAALLAAWALMAQQHTFRESNLSEFGVGLVWCSVALVLYGLVGQAFVRTTPLPTSTYLDAANFLAWFGIPVQLFRGLLAVILTFFMLRVLGVFQAEDRRRLEETNRARLAAQSARLASLQESGRKLEMVNSELTLAMQKLSLLLDVSDTLHSREAWPEPMTRALRLIVNTLTFAGAGLILLAVARSSEVHIAAELGYEDDGAGLNDSDRAAAAELGKAAISDGLLHCVHLDGSELRITLEEVLQQQGCRRSLSPTLSIALPLQSRGRTIGSIALTNDRLRNELLTAADLGLMVGIAQELGLSIENALLHRQAYEREQTLARLLGQTVEAQEGERQRIARELHDTTGQSLSAIGLGLRGIQATLESNSAGEIAAPLEQLDEVLSYTNDALRELHGMIADLRPPLLDELGLEAAVRSHAAVFERRWGIPVEFVSTGEASCLSDDYSTVLFRIAQEALRNVAKHAAATRVRVSLSCNGEAVRLRVEDDGRGFELEKLTGPVESSHSWGLAGMKERAILVGGELDIETAPGEGTAIVVSIPSAPVEISV